MRVAIVGATGMLGQHTSAAAAAAGHDAVAIARSNSSLQRLANAPLESRLADLDDRESLRRALKNIDAVVNCAGYYPTVPRQWRAEVETATRQMENFYAACAEQPLRKIVYLGGAIALRRHPAGEPGDETLDANCGRSGAARDSRSRSTGCVSLADGSLQVARGTGAPRRCDGDRRYVRGSVREWRKGTERVGIHRNRNARQRHQASAGMVPKQRLRETKLRASNWTNLTKASCPAPRQFHK